jgi:hypothetical protein
MTDRVSAHVGFTIQLFQYEPLKVDAGLETDVRPGETLAQAYDRAFNVCQAQVEFRLREWAEAMRKVRKTI